MQFFSPDRPEISPGIKAILIDGSAMPHIVCQPRPDGTVRLACLLRQYDGNAAYEYAYHETHLPPDALGEFFRHYAEDPEGAFHLYFAWTPKAGGIRRQSAPSRPAAPAAPSADFDSSIDLL